MYHEYKEPSAAALAVLDRYEHGERSLRSTQLYSENLRDFSFYEADLTYSDLVDCDLRGANLSRASLRNGSLRSSDLTGADLMGCDLTSCNLDGVIFGSANLSGVKGIPDATEWLETHCEASADGYIVYKTFGANYSVPGYWTVEPGTILQETVCQDRSIECGCGVNVATMPWQLNQRQFSAYRPLWKCLIRWAWLAGVVVPYSTDGKIRAARVELVETVEPQEDEEDEDTYYNDSEESEESEESDDSDDSEE